MLGCDYYKHCDFLGTHTQTHTNTDQHTLTRLRKYFGEITLWVGLALSSVPSLYGGEYAVLICPFMIALLIIKISGIPLLEKSADVGLVWYGIAPDTYLTCLNVRGQYVV